MNNWCVCWFLTHILLAILIFKGLTARRLYKSFGVKGLITSDLRSYFQRQYPWYNDLVSQHEYEMYFSAHAQKMVQRSSGKF
jgi:hypothetical protein